MTEIEKAEAEETSLESELIISDLSKGLNDLSLDIEDSNLDEEVIEVEEITDGIYVPVQEPDVVEYTDPAGNTFEAIDFHNAVTAEIVPEANLDLLAPETKTQINSEDADFDLDFAPTDVEDNDNDDVPDFF